MDEASLLKEIEKLRQKMYRLSKSRTLNSQEMINCSQRLDHLINMYQKRRNVHSYKNKQQGH